MKHGTQNALLGTPSCHFVRKRFEHPPCHVLKSDTPKNASRKDTLPGLEEAAKALFSALLCEDDGTQYKLAPASCPMQPGGLPSPVR